MSKFLLDYVFPISVITPTPQASTGFLKQACLVVKPKSGQEGNVGTFYECTSMSEVSARTDNTDAQQMFNAGMSKVFILLANDLYLVDFLDTEPNSFYTLLVSSDFDKDDVIPVLASLVKDDLTFTAVDAPGSQGNLISIEFVTGGTAGMEAVTVTGTGYDKKISVSMDGGVSTATQLKAALDGSAAAAALISTAIASGQGSSAQAAFAEDQLEDGVGLFSDNFKGVVGVWSDDTDFLEDQAVIDNRVAFFGSSTNKGKSMAYAFGSMLSNASNWLNQQYITMPLDDGIDTLGEANSLFDSKISFALNDDEFGKKLALFAAGQRAIVAPYILKNLRIDLQSRATQWISGNQPAYNLKNAALLETRLQEDVINSYIARGLITEGTVEITLVQSNFVANGDIEVPQPKALWRVTAEMRETV